ncbi:hypothetical protein G7Y89_g14931 [Cudoniella acicularis]|uniref:Uncharacterized protein n=1 Tax=Cudoniella acicularis TaxID=354080 RepID=A0A8H4QWX7_9HELO|nr:hypothetical protein G7Y89_g14931 [Cudoniella acicularis]
MATPSFDPNTTPLSLNPSGAPPNFVNPQSQALTVLGTGILLTILSTLCVCTRLYTSLKSAKKLHLDDYCATSGLYGLMYRLGRSERSNIPSIAEDGNQYKSNKYSVSRQDQPNSMPSTKSLVGSGKNIPIIEMAELEPKKTSQASPYSTLGKQESGQMGPRS